jgi:Fe2+ or Zn2+ uptake regulation protein
MKDDTLPQAIVARIREGGYRLTNARRAVLNILVNSREHLTSREILRRVHAIDSNIGRASVFRTLELLTTLSIIRPTYLESRTPHYIFMPADGHHAHLICTHCQQVIELGACKISDQIEQYIGSHHFNLTGHLLEIYGLCTECAE